MSNYYGKIDLSKINAEWVFHGKNGAEYLDLAIRENKNGPGKFGDTHMIIQSPSQEARKADPKVRGPIIGNAKLAVRRESQAQGTHQHAPSRKSPPPQENIDEDVPF